MGKIVLEDFNSEESIDKIYDKIPSIINLKEYEYIDIFTNTIVYIGKYKIIKLVGNLDLWLDACTCKYKIHTKLVYDMKFICDRASEELYYDIVHDYVGKDGLTIYILTLNMDEKSPLELDCILYEYDNKKAEQERNIKIEQENIILKEKIKQLESEVELLKKHISLSPDGEEYMKTLAHFNNLAKLH